MNMPIHEQVTVQHPTEGEIEVDAGIAPLLKVLWKAGVDTSMSCQCTEGERVWIEFPTSCDVERFLLLVANHLDLSRERAHVDHTVYRRMTDPLVPDAWSYETYPLDVTELFKPHEWVNGGAAEFMVTISV